MPPRTTSSLVPNGCDVEHFREASVPTGVLRPPLDGPIVGYYGAVSAGWFDAGLLSRSPPRGPTGTSSSSGPSTTRRERFSIRARTSSSSARSRTPSCRATAPTSTSGIIPFLVNDLTAATDPVKLYEYFAAGKPVVTTPLPELYPLQGPLVVAATAADFERAVESFLDDPGDPGPRRVDRRGGRLVETRRPFLPTDARAASDLDVVVLTRDNADLTRRCLDSVARDTSYQARLVVVDNASTDGTAGVPRRHWYAPGRQRSSFETR